MKTLFRIIKFAIIIFFLSSILAVFTCKFVNPPFTPLMIIRNFEYFSKGKDVKIKYKYVPFHSISPNMVRAVITVEDQNFEKHNGFDFKAIAKAKKKNEQKKGKKVYGASTISQQTAKNVFLFPQRSWLRKGLEAYFTILIELIWSKERIMEVYLNEIEFGEGIYGVEAAAQKYYNKSAKDLTIAEASSLASILPNPRKWSPINKNRFVKKRTNWIIRNHRKIGKIEILEK